MKRTPPLSASAARWLAFLPLVQGTHFLLGDALMGAGRQAARSIAQAGVAVLNVVVNLWLIRSFSWRGAAVASSITYVAVVTSSRVSSPAPT